jgi:DnaK suppressor protein
VKRSRRGGETRKIVEKSDVFGLPYALKQCIIPRFFSHRQESKMPAKKASNKRKTARASRKKSAKRTAVSRKKTSAKKRTVSKKKVAKKKTSKKKVSKKKAVARKKSATKKKKVSKKKSAPKKKVSNKKVAKKKAASKKKPTPKKAASKKKVGRKKPAARKPSKKAATRSAARPKSRSPRSDLLSGPIHGVEPYVSNRGEDYMSGDQLGHFEAILSSWKRELMTEVDRTVHHMQDEAANFPDPNDRATQESEFGLELRTRDRERKLLRKISSALIRIDEGSYGFCEETGEEIGLKRLEARPVATLSVEAQERRELAERQFRDRDDRYR